VAGRRARGPGAPRNDARAAGWPPASARFRRADRERDLRVAHGELHVTGGPRGRRAFDPWDNGEEWEEGVRMASDEESKKERVDRELIELLNELRVALPGVQVLFAFMLVVPFNQRFTELTTAERCFYYAAFVSAALGVALLIAPSSYHRLRFRQGDKERMLFTSNRLMVAGMAF